MNQQYPDTLHLAISVSTTSSHFLLLFSSPTPFSHSILSFSSCVFSFRSFSPSVLSHSFFFLPFLSFIFHFHPVFHSVFHPVFHSSLFPINPTNTLKTRILQRYASYRLRGYSTLFSTYPPVSVFQTSAEHSENKSYTGFPLLQTAGGGHQSVKQHLASKH